MLELRNIHAGYKKENDVLHGVNLTVHYNEVIAIIGQNGSGKSTLAKCILHLLPFVKGEVEFDGKSLIGLTPATISKKGIGLLMQGGRIFSHLTVEENLLFAANGMNKNAYFSRLDAIMLYFDLLGNGRMNLQASSLSGGEQHQLALAMVLMQKPRLLILDEPSAGLSPVNVKSLYESLYKIRESETQSIIIVEQNVGAAINFSDRVVLLQEGRIKREELSKNLLSADNIDNYFFWDKK